jgi:hypothetical protein
MFLSLSLSAMISMNVVIAFDAGEGSFYPITTITGPLGLVYRQREL